MITDFRTGDKIDLRAIDADTDGTAGDQAFRYIGSAAFSGVDGQLRYANGILSGDLNGDKVADFQIALSNVRALAATDFFSEARATLGVVNGDFTLKHGFA